VHYVYYVHIIFVHLLKLSYLIDLIGLLVLVDANPGWQRTAWIWKRKSSNWALS
jgi:hypothetical protein